MADNKQTKSIGEFWVCAELAMRGWDPALTRDGVARTDILAIKADSAYQVSIQVKTTCGQNWPLNILRIGLEQQGTEWFVMVKVDKDSNAIQGFVVPRNHVIAGTWIGHQNWLTDPDAKPGKRNTGIKGARMDISIFEGYKDRWDLLERSTSECPVLLPAWEHDAALQPRVGLPDGHPWKESLPEW
ncbi:hypothetical protein BPY_23360 [Bifidobacterium psychraerophilum]|uniref:hypothetical protein n=1 Tax=Bifidobacterium psychraerophilum TaxID=218140 RepID=UPI003112D51F